MRSSNSDKLFVNFLLFFLDIYEVVIYYELFSNICDSLNYSNTLYKYQSKKIILLFLYFININDDV